MVQVQNQSLPNKPHAIVPEKIRPSITVHINGKPFFYTDDPNMPLLWYLRDILRLTGTKYGGEGSGADLVLIDDQAIPAEKVAMHTLSGKHIVTVEGLAANEGNLHPLQQAFIEEDAFGCGYCTSGWLIAGVALLKRHPLPDDHAIDTLPNLCLCGCQTRVRAAIHRAAKLLQEKGNSV